MVKRIGLFLAVLSCAAFAVAVARMWVRSNRALDQCYGVVASTFFEVSSYANRIEIFIWRPYKSRAGAEQGPNLLDAPRPFQLLEFDSAMYDEPFIARARWPLAETDLWQADAPLFTVPEYKAWLAWARQGPGHFMYTRRLQVPYWLLFAAFVSVPALAVFRRLRRCRSAPASRDSDCTRGSRGTSEKDRIPGEVRHPSEADEVKDA